MLHPSESDLQQYVTGQLTEADAAVVQAHLEGCEECQLRLADVALQAQWKDTELRREPRVPVNLVGRLKLLDPVTSVGPPHDVRVVEISRSGLKIRTPRFLIPKTLVQIVFDGKPVLGEVRYCAKVDSEYLAGIKQIQNFPGAS